MFKNSQTDTNRALYSITLGDALSDFYLSRRAMLCSPATLEFYEYTAGHFVERLQKGGVKKPAEVSAHHVRDYLSGLASRGLKDNTVHCHARAIKTFMRFCLAENYTQNAIKFAMPKVAKKKLPVLTGLELSKLLQACGSPRDLALVMFLADTGARRAELLSLTWGDVNLENGMVQIARGKGGKSRAVVAGVKTRRALLKYRRMVEHEVFAPLFQTQTGTRLAASGLRSLLQRIGRRAGISVSPHVFRRTFATMSLRAGMNVLHLQGLMGHSSLEMTQRYVNVNEIDLLDAHVAHGPIDNLGL